jgi:hypothetical protein
MESTTKTTTKVREPTIDEIRATLQLLTRLPGVEYAMDTPPGAGQAASSLIKSEALASIFETALGEPRSGLRYRAELEDLCQYIHGFSNDACEDMDLRMLAMMFGYTTYTSDVMRDDGHPFMQAATIDLVRAVATFFLRRDAFSLAMSDDALAEVGVAK